MNVVNTLKKIFCIVADYREISPLLQTLSFKQINHNLYSHIGPNYHLDLYIVHVWGSMAMLEALQNYPRSSTDYDLWINLGFAGACSPKIPLGKCYNINQIGKLSNDSPPRLTEDLHYVLESLPDSLPQNSLVTSPTTYHYGFHETFKLVDMEGYAIASEAAYYEIPCAFLKIVSDYTIPGDNPLDKRAQKLSENLTQILLKALPELIKTATPPKVLLPCL
ncbi:nucleosidase,Phosphorylase superfamily [Chlamydia serpentis]|uniref:Nucleosidase,Phosphorylase superfamily n=1 Tax=Chlamydia serpentis TaxID=1967782 RepID=A0A2R8FB74_9CHLA|nr:hypothetical protein [Chlamydia serpentis]SPN73546.1 nucleosidase,Phosphorylase superfamily [Chlamydia serpentis]